jgi:hypothetical protein
MEDEISEPNLHRASPATFGPFTDFNRFHSLRKQDYELYPSSVYDAYRKVMSLAREYALKHAIFR